MVCGLVEYRSSRSPWQVFQSVYQNSRICFFLDSGSYNPPNQRFSYIGGNPFLTVTLDQSRLKLAGEEKGVYPAKQFFPVMRRLFHQYRSMPRQKAPFFCGGAVGFLGYEAAGLFDKVHFREKPGTKVPRGFFGFYRDLIVYDHKARKYFVVSSSKTKQDFLRNVILRAKPDPKGLLRRESREMLRFAQHDKGKEGKFHVQSFRPDISRARFESMVRSAKAYIAAGDIYQANLSQRFSFRFKGSPLRLFDQLRQINPSPFSSFLSAGDLKIISSSPERLIQKRGNLCETRPIAGTRPRKKCGASPASLGRELLANEKERAEHVMLVDLERNDLGRVCDYKSVRVREMMGLEKYSHVLHIVSSITGRLRKEKDGLDLLRAMFPGGTITGCPKIRCMEIIDELEPVGRGIYTGSLGWLDFKGDLDLNIVIRTLVLNQNKGTFQVGAGIVHDSDPAREYEETLQKGEALAEALVKAGL